MIYKANREFAQSMDDQDPLKAFRNEFHIPTGKDGKELIYLCGNSLGLMPKLAHQYVNEELEDWSKLGVEGHTEARHPWMPYHEFLTTSMAKIVGAKPSEVVVMNSLTVNLHFLMVSFYRPTKKRYKILIDYSPFPSDRYAVESQARFHGFDPNDAIIELQPEEGGEIVSNQRVLQTIREHSEELALVLIGGVNYYTGQAYNFDEIVREGHSFGAMVGFDMAHAAGNLPLQLHDSGADFAAWCSYKYLNSGPGSLSGIFVHERHHPTEENIAANNTLPRFHGWWGHDKSSRFKMGPNFVPIPTAEAWQLSNPPILPMAAMRASLEIFDRAGMSNLTKKSVLLSGYLEFLLNEMGTDKVSIITPKEVENRGCQISIQAKGGNKQIFDALSANGVISDWREPDVIRVAPIPLYNSFMDIFEFVERLKAVL